MADDGTQQCADEPNLWQQWYWLLGWTALLTVPQLVYYVLKGKSADDKTARFNRDKDVGLLAMLVVLAAFTPFIPLLGTVGQLSGNDNLGGGADLTAVLLNVLALLTQMADQWQFLAQSRKLARKYAIADTLVRGMQQPPSAELAKALDNNANRHYFGCLEDFRMGKMEGRHKINWDGKAQQLRLSSRLEEDFSRDNYGVRYRLVALFGVLQNNCSAPYCLTDAMFRQMHSALGGDGWWRFNGCSTLILQKAVQAAGVPDWELALQERERMSESEIAVSRLEMKLGRGLPELPSLEVFRDIAKEAEMINTSNRGGLVDQAAEQVTYDLAVLAAELIVISDHLCCERKQAAGKSDADSREEAQRMARTPLAHYIMDEFFNNDKFKKLRARYSKANDLWLLWLLTALSVVPVLLVLVFCLLPRDVLQPEQQTKHQPDRVQAPAQRQNSLRQARGPEHPIIETGRQACMLLALAIRTLMSNQSMDYLSDGDPASASGEDELQKLSVKGIHDKLILAGMSSWQGMLNPDEIESARMLLNLGMRHTYAAFKLVGEAPQVELAPVA